MSSAEFGPDEHGNRGNIKLLISTESAYFVGQFKSFRSALGRPLPFDSETNGTYHRIINLLQSFLFSLITVVDVRSFRVIFISWMFALAD